MVWVSDGGHTVHMMSLSDIEYSVGGNVEEERKSTMIQISGLCYVQRAFLFVKIVIGLYNMKVYRMLP